MPHMPINPNLQWCARVAFVARAFVLCSAVLASATAFSFEYWIGRPTMGDYMRASVQDAIVSAQQYQKAIGNFQGDIDRARRAFFEASRWKKEAAGDEFGKYLFAKDIMIATPLLVSGYSDHAQGVGKLFAALNGNRVVDGGIRPTARDSYDAWVRAMRTSMGARNETDVVFMNEAKLQAALQASQGAYNAYRQERDLAETRIWRSFNPPEAERVGNRPLRKPGEEISVAASLTARRTEQAFMQSEVQAAETAGARRIQCEYGPSYDENGIERFGQYHFWKDKPPANIARLMAFDSYALGGVQDHSVSACPSQEAEASRITKSPVKTEVPAALRDEVRSTQEGARQAERIRIAQKQEAEAKARADAKAKRDAEQMEVYTRNMKAYSEKMQREQQAYQEAISPQGRARAAAAQQAASAAKGGPPVAAGGARPTVPATGPVPTPEARVTPPTGQRPQNDYRRYSEELKLCQAQYREGLGRGSSADRAAAREQRQQCHRQAQVVSGLR